MFKEALQLTIAKARRMKTRTRTVVKESDVNNNEI
jgi:hypothetical protein